MEITRQLNPVRTLLAQLIRPRSDTHYEQFATNWLRLHGLRLLQRNFRSKSGEVDIIMRDRDTTVFVEVKYRTSENTALDAVNYRKQQRIMRAAQQYCLKHPVLQNRPMRFDVITIEKHRGFIPSVSWYKGAFDAP